MKKTISIFTALCSIMLLLTVSAWSFSPLDVIIAKINGDDTLSKVYPVTVYQAWEITLAVLQLQEVNTIEEHYKENYVLTSIGPEDCPCRTEVGVWVEPENKHLTKVTITIKGRVHKNDFTNLLIFPDTIEPDFHHKFEKGVQIVKRSGKLPLIPPKD